MTKMVFGKKYYKQKYWWLCGIPQKSCLCGKRNAKALVWHVKSIGYKEVGRRTQNGQVVVNRHWINEQYTFMGLQKIPIVYAPRKVSLWFCHLWAFTSTSYVKTWLQLLWWSRQQTGEQACCLIISNASSAISILSAFPVEGQHIICLCVLKNPNTFDTSLFLFLFMDVGFNTSDGTIQMKYRIMHACAATIALLCVVMVCVIMFWVLCLYNMLCLHTNYSLANLFRHNC